MASNKKKASEGRIDDEILRAIGLGVVNFSQVEEVLALAVNFLMIGKPGDRAVDMVLTRLPFSSLIDTFRGLYRHRFPKDDFSALQELCNQLKKLNKERNDLVHSNWSPGSVAAHVRRYKQAVKRGGPRLWDENLTEADILKFAQRAEETAEQLLDFVVEDIVGRIEAVIPKPRR